MKAGLLMALESSGARAEQLARQMFIYGRPMPLEEIVAQDRGGDGRERARGRARADRARPAGDRGARARPGLESAAAIAESLGASQAQPDGRPATQTRMAFFRTVSFSEPLPAIVGERRRAARAADVATIAEWAALREASRDFLTPWEPTWPADDLTRGAFRRRLKRYAEDQRSRSGLSVLRRSASSDNVLVGGLTLANIRRGVAQAGSLGYWMGAPYARQRLHDRGACAPCCRSPSGRCGCIASRPPASRPTSPRSACWRRSGFQREGYARAISVHQRDLAGPSALCAPQGRPGALTARSGRGCDDRALGLPRLRCYKAAADTDGMMQSRDHGRARPRRVSFVMALSLLASCSTYHGLFASRPATAARRADGHDDSCVVGHGRPALRPVRLRRAGSRSRRRPHAHRDPGHRLPGRRDPPGRLDVPAIAARTTAPTALSLRYQVTFIQIARECTLRGGNVVMKVGVQGRVIVGPAGAPGPLTLPLRSRWCRKGSSRRPSGPSSTWCRSTIPPGQPNVLFTHIEEDMSFPNPPGSDLDTYVVYVGFDPDSAEAEKKKPAKPPEPAPKPKR